MQAILEVKNLTKKYKERIAVDNISFDVYQGEVFGFLGPNGAGKTTTMKMIMGITPITSGSVYINSHSVTENFESAMKNVGAIVETPSLFNYLSGRDNLKYFARLHGKISETKLNEVVHLVGLSNRINEKVSKYSLGMKQRLGIAVALLHSPKLLILDEPTNGLDANGIKEMRDFLKGLAAQHRIAIMVSSHILSEMENLCDRIAIIANGRIVEEKSIKAIKENIRLNGSMYMKVSHPHFAGKTIQEKYRVPVKISNQTLFFTVSEDSLAGIIAFLTQKRIAIFGAGKINFSLEDVFLKATGVNNQIS